MINLYFFVKRVLKKKIKLKTIKYEKRNSTKKK
jgi:hypothetical protein